MSRRGTIVSTALLLLVLAATAEPDPWALPEVEGALLVVEITESARTYGIYLEDGIPDGAAGPDRVELPLKSHETRVLTKYREVMAEGDFTKAEKAMAAQVRKNRQNYDALALRARCQIELGQVDLALANLKSSLIGNRRNPEAWEILEQFAAATGKKVVRPQLVPRGWIGEKEDDEIPVAYDVEGENEIRWLYYAVGRAVYRYERRYQKDFPGEDYRYTFRELLYALGAALTGAEEGTEMGEELQRLLAEKEADTLVPFAYFALYTEPLPKEPERDFDKLRPVLESYFDEHILVPAEPEEADGD